MAQTLEAVFYQGHQVRIDHTPGSALAVGKIVDLGNICGVVTSPEGIAANTLGSVDVDGIYRVIKDGTSGPTFAVGADVFWDTVNRLAVASSGSNIIRLGMAMEAAGDSVDGVITWINRDGPQA